MTLIKKNRYKPLYKKFLILKKNTQNRQKILKFKKRKWNRLKLDLKRFEKVQVKENLKHFKKVRVKKIILLYDHNKYFIPKFSNSFKKKFKYNLHVKQRFSLFYGGFVKKYLKKTIKFLQSSKKIAQKKVNSNIFLLMILECRLDSILYRAHFSLSIRSSRQLISHGHVYINGKIVKNKSFLVKKGDLIEIENKLHYLIETSIRTSCFWPLPPKYLQINYKTFQIVLNEDILFINLFSYYPFWLDLNTFIDYYKH